MIYYIEEDYTSLDISKLLKEKGFNLSCEYHYHYIEELGNWFITSQVVYSGCEKFYYPCPTIQRAMKWLREIHHYHIMVNCIGNKRYIPTVQFTYRKQKQKTYDNISNDFRSYEEACEAAIMYCLENLI